MKKYVLIAKNKSEKNPKEFILMGDNNTMHEWDSKKIFFQDLSDMKMLSRTNPTRIIQCYQRRGKYPKAFIMVFPTALDAKKMLFKIFYWADHCAYWKDFIKTHYIRIANANSENFPYEIPEYVDSTKNPKKYLNYVSIGKTQNIAVYKQLVTLDGFLTKEFYSKNLSDFWKRRKMWNKRRRTTQKYLISAGLKFEDIAIIAKEEDYKDYKYKSELEFSDISYSYEINYTKYYYMHRKNGRRFSDLKTNCLTE